MATRPDPLAELRGELLDEFRRIAAQRVAAIRAVWVQAEPGEFSAAARDSREPLHRLHGDAKLMGFGKVALVLGRLESGLNLFGKRGTEVEASLVVEAIDAVGSTLLEGLDSPAAHRSLLEIGTRIERASQRLVIEDTLDDGGQQ